MKQLLTAAVLTVLLSSPVISFASDSNNSFGVKHPIVKSDVKDDVRGEVVETDFISFYKTPKTAENAISLSRDLESNDDDSYIVFGVRISPDENS